MPQNDPVTDSLNYGGMPGVGGSDFDEVIFDDVEEGDLFWLTTSLNSDENNAYRKIDAKSAVNTRTQKTVSGIDKNHRVYFKI